jgi:hypothetical protein
MPRKLATHNEFVNVLLKYMAGKNMPLPADLWRAINERATEENSIPWSTFYSYFEGRARPSRWFVKACVEALELGQRRRLRLYDAYFKSYR